LLGPRFGEQLPRFPLLRSRRSETIGRSALLFLRGLALELQRLLHQIARNLRVGVGLRLLFERVLQHRGEHARGMSEPHAIEAGFREAFDQVVDRKIRGRAGEYLLPTGRGATDQLDQHRGLASAGRTVDQRDIQRLLAERDRGLLLGIKMIRLGIKPRLGILIRSSF